MVKRAEIFVLEMVAEARQHAAGVDKRRPYTGSYRLISFGNRREVTISFPSRG